MFRYFFNRAPDSNPTRFQLGCLGVGVLLASLLPLFVNDYWVRLLIFVFVNISLASSWNLIGGFGGYASFGHGVFFGLGAFTGAIGLVRYNLPFPLVLVLGAVVAAALAAMFVPVFKQKGLYFALSTLAVMLVFETVLQRWEFTRGLRPADLGWNVPTLLSVDQFYYVFLAILAAVLASMILIVNSKIGYALHAIRKDEVLAASIGIRTIKYKTIAFMISAAWPGLLGAAFAPFLAYVSVQSVFDVAITLNMILITIFGGTATLIGPVVGGVVLSIIDHVAWGNFLNYHRLIYGALIVAIITIFPGGIVSVFMAIAGCRHRKTAAASIAAAQHV
jgi:branched-chain amino acid transport system permease protein